MMGMLDGVREGRELNPLNLPERWPVGIQLWEKVSEMFTTRIVGVVAFPDRTVVNLCVVVHRGK